MEKIFKYFASNRLLVNIIILTVLILGIYTVINLKQDLYPLASLDTILISVIYPGASPIDVEMNAVIPIERKLEGINGIKEYTSISVENSARIEVYLDQDISNIDQVKNDIFRELENVPDLAEDVDDIKIYDVNPKLRSIFEIGIHKTKNNPANDKILNKYIDKLEEKVLNIKGVNTIRKEGYSNREIIINVLPNKMDKFYISLNDVIKSIQDRNVRITAGTLQSIAEDKTIITIGQFDDPMEVKDVIIRSSFEENRVKIKNIAEIEDGFKKKNIKIKINSMEGAALKVVKKENADVVKTAKRINTLLKEIRHEIPDGLEVTVIKDDSKSITSLLKVVRTNALFGFLFVFIVLFIFLMDIKTSFWTAFCIPITILLTMIFIKLTGFTINIVSLGALVTVMGMLVDHGIVISENIYDYRIKGYKNLDAVSNGIKDVFAPVSITIITTIVAFIPMFFIKGMMGKVIYVFPSIIIFALIASFLESTLILPSHLISSKNKTYNNKFFFINKNWFEVVSKFYKKSLIVILKFRYLTAFIFLTIFALTILISINPIKNFILLDDESSDRIFIKLEAAKGTNLEKTYNLTKKIEDIILQEIDKKYILSIKTLCGHHTVEGIKHKGNHENWALIGINLVPITERKKNADELITLLRKKMNSNSIADFEKIMILKDIKGPPTGDPIDIKIIGNNKKDSNKVKNEIYKILNKIDGVVDIDDDQKEGKTEIIIDFDYNQMAKLGINVAMVAQTVRAAYEGVIASSIETTEKKLDFRVKIADSFHKDKIFLENLLIPNKLGRLIKLKEIAKFNQRKSKSSINHYNGDRVITITANIVQGKTTPTKVINHIKEQYNVLQNTYPEVELKYSGEAKETQETLKDLKFAFIIAVILIYFVLILLFRSVTQPLIVMITIPFGIIGAMLALILHGIPLSFLAIIGIIGLSGVVVNDSVIMVDFINKVFKKNNNIYKIKILIAQGAKKRLRPVILTTLTTIAGLLPTAYGLGGDAGMLVPIVLSIAYGILFATTLTLIFIPSLYMIRIDIMNLFNKLKYFFIKS